MSCVMRKPFANALRSLCTVLKLSLMFHHIMLYVRNASFFHRWTASFYTRQLRDAIYNKWGQCFDVNFQPVSTFGFRELYLNVMPVCLGSKRFRHETELDYLCHLQAVVSTPTRTT